MVSIRAVPISSKPSTPVISPRDAMTVPPGTPGAPTANTPNSTQNRVIVGRSGRVPYRIFDTTMTKNTSVSTEPHRWILANRGIPNSTISSLSVGSDFFAQSKATARVAAEDMVPTAVR